MKKGFGAVLALFAAILPAGFILAQSQGLEQKIWTLLDDGKAAYVSLAESDLRALGAGLDLPDGGRSITALAGRADGGAFDPRDVARLPAQRLGYKADWIVERFRRYNLDWDITALRLTSLNPEAKNYPWFIIINGGAANFYEFYVDLKNRPGWAQYLAQKLNVMIVTIPGNFKYGGWDLPVLDARRQPAYLLDRDLSMDEYEMRNAIYTNSLILQEPAALKSVKDTITAAIDGQEYQRTADRAIDVRAPPTWRLSPNSGYPAIAAPAGFTREVYDRAVVRGEDGAKKAGELVGPKAVALPVSIDFLGRPFSEPLLIRIAAAYEKATRHRRPPKDFGPVAGEP